MSEAEADRNTGSYESKEETLRADSEFVRAWLQAIEVAGDEEKDWRKEADEADKTYRAKSDAQNTDFNILMANVETSVPALYNSTPVPDIRRRYADPSPIARDIAQCLERVTSYYCDRYDFDACMYDAVQDMELAGRGVVRIKFEDNRVWCEHFPWGLFRRGPGLTWAQVPWIAFGHFMSRAQIRELIPDNPELAERIPLNHSQKAGDKDEHKDKVKDIFKRGFIWEVWDRETQRVLFLCQDWPNEPVKIVDDPLELEGFFPTPRPLYALKSTKSLVPVNPHSTYTRLRDELNDVSVRIRKLIKQLRVRGLYAGDSDDIKALAEADDGELVPATEVDVFKSGGGLEKALAFWPLDPIVKALVELYKQRDVIKQTIYEVTGISDIFRGQTEADETLGAQEIKSQWGTLRLKRKQNEVGRYARDLFRMMGELAATKVDPQFLMAATGIQLQPEHIMLMRDDVKRSFQIDIESDSTVRSDLTRSQKTMTEFLNATASFIAALGPAVEAKMMPPDVAIAIYTSFARQFDLGKQAEDALDRFQEQALAMAQQPQQAEPDPKVQAEVEKIKVQTEGEVKKTEAKLAMQQKESEMKMGIKQMEAAQNAKIKMFQAARQPIQPLMPANPLGGNRQA